MQPDWGRTCDSTWKPEKHESSSVDTVHVSRTTYTRDEQIFRAYPLAEG